MKKDDKMTSEEKNGEKRENWREKSEKNGVGQETS